MYFQYIVVEFPGDFNGDGKMEIFAVSNQNPFGWENINSTCYLFDLESNKKLYEDHVFQYAKDFAREGNTDGQTIENNSDKLLVLDYDGDGKSDICLINSDGVKIYSFTVSGSTYSLNLVSTYTGLKRSDLQNRKFFPGEFNGDGKVDLLVSPVKGGGDYTWAIHYAKGDGQFEKTTFSRTSNPSSSFEGFIVQDVNGDGLTDLIKYSLTSFSTYLATNNIIGNYDSYASFNSLHSILVPTNINSRNYFHPLVALQNDGKVTRFTYSRNDTKEKLLTGVVTGLGIVHKNYYRMINESSGFYTKGSDASYPYMNFQGAIFVPAYREQYFNGVKNEDYSYRYENAVIHKQGLGFRGFKRVSAYDNIRGRSVYREHDPYNFGILKKEESPTVTNTYTHSISVASNRIVKIRMTGNTSLDRLKNTTVSSSYSYDTYGNMTVASVNYGGGITVSMAKTYYNNTDETNYLLGYLTDETKTTTRNGAAFKVRSHIPSHNNKGLANTKITYINDGQVLEEQFTYDSKGNVTQKKRKNYSSSGLLTTGYAYDAYGRLIEETNPLGFKTTYEYNAANGSLTAQKNHKNQATTYTYDAFGRKTSVTHPDGVVESTAFSWEAGGTNGLFSVTQTATGRPTAKTYYDALGRETRTASMRFDASYAYVYKLYDSYGRLEKVSLPFTGTSATLFNTYSYDSYDRPASIREASGKTTSYSYSGNSLTTTKNGITSTQTFDTQGNVISVSDPAGTITYNLRPDGQPASIVAPGNVTTSFAYDAYGRKTGISDPSAGTQTWTYDAAGNIATEKDATNKTVSYTYDSYNRLTQKIRPEFTTAYAYNADGLIASESSGNGTSTVYAYDSFGRVSTEKETVPDGKFLQKTYTYSNGNVASLAYTTRDGTVTTENYTYTNGHLSEIKLNGTTSIWKLNSVNAFGQPTGATTGSISRTYAYDAYGLPTGRTAGSFQNFSYSFDPLKGNLAYRKDNKIGIQENFTYDNLNRLTGYGGLSAAYDIKGNITQKSDAGSFSYNNSSKPYAISGATLSQISVPLRYQYIGYTSFKRPATVSENACTANFTYNGGEERVKMEVKKNGAKELTRYYLSGCYEIDDPAVGSVKEKLYLGGDYYTAAAVYVKSGSGSWQLYYIGRDYLGSITHIANNSGYLSYQYSYDAWGRLRNPTTQTVYEAGNEPALFLGRGYTGHEYLPWFGLVNMNARLYDPVLGRFLAPDPYVQASDFSQSYNRYSYCLNNPLRYTDPTGEWALIDDIIAAVVGGIVNVIVNAVQGNIHSWGQGFALFGVGAAGTWTGLYAGPVAAGAVIGSGNSFVNQGFGSSGNWNWDNIRYDQVAMGGLMGAGTSYLGGQVSGLIGPHVGKLTSGLGGQAVQQALNQGIVGAGTGFVLGTGAALIYGESLGDALKIGAQGAALGFTTGAISGLVSGMRAAYKAGENPWTGKIRYPSNDGFLGTPETKMLQPGEVVDRYGGTYDGSKYLSPEGTSIEARSLPPNSNLNLYDRYQVAKPFSVQSGTVAPWFGQSGGGIQYNTVTPIKTLINQGYLIPY